MKAQRITLIVKSSAGEQRFCDQPRWLARARVTAIVMKHPFASFCVLSDELDRAMQLVGTWMLTLPDEATE